MQLGRRLAFEVGLRAEGIARAQIEGLPIGPRDALKLVAWIGKVARFFAARGLGARPR